jgi:N-formylglutamate amidohydrolase
MNELPKKLLAADEPAPVTVYNADGESPFVLVADHAGNIMPRALGHLGIAEAECERHIALDIGIAGLGRLLADALDATLIQQNYSRLVQLAVVLSFEFAMIIRWCQSRDPIRAPQVRPGLSECRRVIDLHFRKRLHAVIDYMTRREQDDASSRQRHRGGGGSHSPWRGAEERGLARMGASTRHTTVTYQANKISNVGRGSLKGTYHGAHGQRRHWRSRDGQRASHF